MPAARPAVPAVPAGDMPFTGYPVADFIPLHFLTHIHNFPGILVPHHHGHGDGLLRPFVPVVDMHVRAANGGLADLDQNVVVPHFRLGHIGQPNAFFRFQFCQRFHLLRSLFNYP